jgi:hypothetical protein
MQAEITMKHFRIAPCLSSVAEEAAFYQKNQLQALG